MDVFFWHLIGVCGVALVYCAYRIYTGPNKS
jgi:hypothetical protein